MLTLPASLIATEKSWASLARAPKLEKNGLHRESYLNLQSIGPLPFLDLMSTYESAEVLTLTMTLMPRVSLIPDFRRMHKVHSTGEMSVMPCLLFTNCYVGMFYAIAVDNVMPLFAQAIVVVVSGVFFNYFFYRWAPNQRAVLHAFLGSFLVCSVVTLYSVFALNGYTDQTRASVSTTLGFMTVCTSVGLYISPMATISTVLRTKRSSSMPVTMGVINVFNIFNWATYAALVDDKFILGPNIAGFVLGCTQFILTFVYRAQPANAERGGKHYGIVSIVVLSPEHGARKEHMFRDDASASSRKRNGTRLCKG